MENTSIVLKTDFPRDDVSNLVRGGARRLKINLMSKSVRLSSSLGISTYYYLGLNSNSKSYTSTLSHRVVNLHSYVYTPEVILCMKLLKRNYKRMTASSETSRKA